MKGVTDGVAVDERTFGLDRHYGELAAQTDW